jgi:prolyl oligopeptidase
MKTFITLIFFFTTNTLLAQYSLDESLLLAPKPVGDTYFGKEVVDPYRFLESLQDEKVSNWYFTQDRHAREVLNAIAGKDSISSLMGNALRKEAVSISFPRAAGQNVFYIKTLLTENKELLILRKQEHPEVILFDTESYLSFTAGTTATIDYFEPSPGGKYLAMGVSVDGAEMGKILLLDVEKKALLPEQIDRAMYGNPVWLPDESGFFYSQMQAISDKDSLAQVYHNSKVFFHQIGEKSEEDLEIFSRSLNPNLSLQEIDFPFATIFPGSIDLFVYVYRGTSNDLTIFKAPLSKALSGENTDLWELIVGKEEKVTDFAVFGEALYKLTYKGSPSFQLVKSSLQGPSSSVVIMQPKDGVIEDIHLTRAGLYVQSTQSGTGKLGLIDFTSEQVKYLSLPFEGSIYLPDKSYTYDSTLYFKATSWVHPIAIVNHPGSGEKVFDTGFQPATELPILKELIVEEREVTSHDGVKVPLSIIHKKGIKLDGLNKTLLYGYGAYGISINPNFISHWIPWLELGGIIAVAHVRGGGEKGAAWHMDGLKKNKPNSWKDFIACGEFLIEEGYTSEKYLSALGSSAGGITIGRAITERPELFRAAVIQVGAMNPLRHEFTNNTSNKPEYGTISDSLEFIYLHEMDPYHHIDQGISYPAMLFTAGMNDARLPVWQIGKMVAGLQNLPNQRRPVLLRLDYEGGHFGGGSSQMNSLWTDVFSFLTWQLGQP